MGNVIDSLLNLLSLSADDKTEAVKLRTLRTITQSSDYSTLSKSGSFVQLFDDMFSIKKLDELSQEVLDERAVLLQNIVAFNNHLVESIHFGNAPELTEDDRPDFTSLQSIKAAYDKIQVSSNVTNYTNLTDKNSLNAFSSRTIKSAKDCLKLLPLSTMKLDNIDETLISHNLGDNLFCVNIDEFKNSHSQLLNYIEQKESIIENEKFRKRKHRLLKAAIVMLCGGMFSVCLFLNLFSSGFSALFILVLLIASILFLIWG